MSRSRKNSTEALEQLRSANRKLESEIKKLERRLEESTAPAKPKKIKLHKVVADEPEIEPSKLCSGCKSKNIVEIELGPKKYKICSDCKVRKLIK